MRHVCHLSLCTSFVSERDGTWCVMDSQDQASSVWFLCAAAVCYIEDCVKYVVARFLYTAHHPSIQHIQTVKTNWSSSASYAYINLRNHIK